MTAIFDLLFHSIRIGTALLFGTTGEIVTEKSGSLNLGVEGMMAMGAIGGYLAACATNSLFFGILGAFLSAALGGLIFAFLTVTLQANQNVVGLALTIFGVGVFQFIGTNLVAQGAFPNFNEYTYLKFMCADNGIPFLKDIPYVGRLLFSHNIFVYLGIAVAVACYIVIKKTKFGLKIRAIGENPAAADACGVNVNLYKYIFIIIGGGITGIGGLYLGVVYNGGSWGAAGDWINGMGWISVALVIFANWNTLMAVFGAFFFGMFTALQARKGNLAEAFPQVFGWLQSLPTEFYLMLPFLITALVLIMASVRSKKNAEPGSLGLNYYREER
ncbi:MAG: ABC transporter permease [Oscillospiraceae bacterium]|jgi:simple sugar transport system permease protein|nr:ABC transporter permease [Oscillospiraceae bacterium]